MHKLLHTVALVIIGASVLHANAFSGELPEGWKPALDVQWGIKDSQIELLTRSKKEPYENLDTSLAVNSFWIDSNDSIYLLSNEGRDIKLFVNGIYSKTIKLQSANEFILDFIIDDEHILAIGSHEVFKFSLQGKLIQKKYVFGAPKKQWSPERILNYNNKYILSNNAYIFQPNSEIETLFLCIDASSLNITDCNFIKNELSRGQILDLNNNMIVWLDDSTKTVLISKINEETTYDTHFNIADYSEQYIDFFYSTLARASGSYLYTLLPRKQELQVVKFMFKQDGVSTTIERRKQNER